MEYYSDMKRNEVLMHDTMWMNLENIMILITERSQKQKAIYCIMHLHEISRIGKSAENKSRLVVFQGGGKNGSCSLRGREFLSGVIRKF